MSPARSSICYDLERTLARLDPGSASALERLVRDSLALVETRETAHELDARGWPRDYFENTAGSFAGEPLEDPPAESLPRW
jgi:hypothetical protein